MAITYRKYLPLIDAALEAGDLGELRLLIMGAFINFYHGTNEFPVNHNIVPTVEIDQTATQPSFTTVLYKDIDGERTPFIEVFDDEAYVNWWLSLD